MLRLRAGDERSFETIFKRHHAPLLSYCRHMLGNREEAEDALQQAFLRAHRALLGGSPPRELRPWLYAIARNCCLTTIASRRPTASLEDHEPSLAGLTEQVHERHDLRELVADIGFLPEQQRSALLLSELEDLSHSAIATIVGCPVSKVKALVYQARSTLIAQRAAREAPCDEIREHLSLARGGELRRGLLRRHLSICPGCRDFQHMVATQRHSIAAVLPVLPSVDLAVRVLGHCAATTTAAAGIGASAAAGGGAGAAAGSGTGALAGTSATGVAGIGVTTVGGATGSAGAASFGSILGGGLIGKLAVGGAIAALATASAATIPSRLVHRPPHAHRSRFAPMAAMAPGGSALSAAGGAAATGAGGPIALTAPYPLAGTPGGAPLPVSSVAQPSVALPTTLAALPAATLTTALGVSGAAATVSPARRGSASSFRGHAAGVLARHRARVQRQRRRARLRTAARRHRAIVRRRLAALRRMKLQQRRAALRKRQAAARRRQALQRRRALARQRRSTTARRSRTTTTSTGTATARPVPARGALTSPTRQAPGGNRAHRSTRAPASPAVPLTAPSTAPTRTGDSTTAAPGTRTHKPAKGPTVGSKQKAGTGEGPRATPTGSDPARSAAGPARTETESQSPGESSDAGSATGTEGGATPSPASARGAGRPHRTDQAANASTQPSNLRAQPTVTGVDAPND